MLSGGLLDLFLIGCLRNMPFFEAAEAMGLFQVMMIGLGSLLLYMFVSLLTILAALLGLRFGMEFLLKIPSIYLGQMYDFCEFWVCGPVYLSDV